MLRPSRSLTLALLWLAIVLLPVRAWAASVMPMAMPGEPAAVMQSADETHGSAGVPCHDDSAFAPQSCALCDVCHIAFAALPDAPSGVPAMPPARPGDATVRPVEPAVLAGPERPPRVFVA